MMIQIHTYLLVHKTILWPTQNSESLFIVNSENESLRRLKVFGMLGYWTATLWFGPPSTIITNSRPCHNQVLWDHHYAKKNSRISCLTEQPVYYYDDTWSGTWKIKCIIMSTWYDANNELISRLNCWTM